MCPVLLYWPMLLRRQKWIRLLFSIYSKCFWQRDTKLFAKAISGLLSLFHFCYFFATFMFALNDIWPSYWHSVAVKYKNILWFQIIANCFYSIRHQIWSSFCLVFILSSLSCSLLVEIVFNAKSFTTMKVSLFQILLYCCFLIKMSPVFKNCFTKITFVSLLCLPLAFQKVGQAFQRNKRRELSSNVFLLGLMISKFLFSEKGTFIIVLVLFLVQLRMKGRQLRYQSFFCENFYIRWLVLFIYLDCDTQFTICLITFFLKINTKAHSFYLYFETPSQWSYRFIFSRLPFIAWKSLKIILQCLSDAIFIYKLPILSALIKLWEIIILLI